MISLVGVAKHYGSRTLFSQANLTLGVAERVGLVGANGSGKSTLLEILAGRLEADEGTITRNRRATVGYLVQETPKFTGRTLLEEMLAGHAHLDHLRDRIEVLEEEMRATADPAALEELARQHGEFQRRFEAEGGYDLPAEAKKILGGLAFKDTDFDRPVSAFSGGWLMRLALGRLLLVEPDLLLLDEPTNYLDLESVVWLEGYLRDYPGSIVIVSHDRVLLNRLTTRILEIDAGRVVGYTGNYDAYVRARAVREEGLEAARKAQEREIAHMESFIERFRAKNTKARQVQSRVKRLEKIERIDSPARRRTMKLAFPDPPPSSKILLELRRVGKRYGDLVVYDAIDLAVERGERIALVGPNGAGKSTLLKILAGVLAPDSGERRLGRGAVVAYYAQHQVEALDYRKSILEEVAAAASHLSEERVRGLLGRFLFSGDDVRKTIGVLSGGEKARVALSKLLVNPPNLLLLDEPTSHLDIPSRDRLAEALAEYEGSLVMISHDRHFIAGLANRVIESGNGGIRSFLADYDSYLDRAAAPTPAAGALPATAEPPPADARGRGYKSRDERRKEAEARNQRYRTVTPVKKEIDGLEREIESATARIAALEEAMANPELYKDGPRFAETLRDYRACKEKVESKTRRWEELSIRLESLEREIAEGT